MEFNLNDSRNAFLIRSISENEVKIDEKVLIESCIISNSKLSTELNITTISALTAKHIEKLLENNPEIVIIGSGQNHEFPDVNLLNPIALAGVGFEVMNNQSAARTYNVLVSEERKVACLLILA